MLTPLFLLSAGAAAVLVPVIATLVRPLRRRDPFYI